MARTDTELQSRPRLPHFYRLAVCGSLLVLCLTFVLGVTMRPNPLDAGYGNTMAQILAALHHHGVPE
ncbi:MAG: hypothetical protein KIT69_00980 [Propionibacteriaceae bacterium]|nr:hypothetical protein [Propionibacteriaceae bacterium]